MSRMLAATGDGGGGNLYGARGRARKKATRIMRHRESRQFQRSLLPQGELPTPLVDLSDCIHGCNGDCLARGGADSPCGYTCHQGRA